MYITTIILTKYCKNVLRNAQNKQEIRENMKNTIESILESHKWWDQVIEITAYDEQTKTEHSFFIIKIEDANNLTILEKMKKSN